mmetsp:Transcript_18634/g.45851  ORF Transcript_18634/g.45851 Transcript_18634/m.45851 type:complete len:181 (-) Transcript_18634:85-627(-)|eukprot:CAMPEP_0198325986 /NCGR_PEP_ID=MMETSP1450-20131203/13610_1 /TAXON_ID=753684 ORGANISM="Madagascaria erythrocladiodes, Strain CCMP3234" /NCGR_SAMPLE_ID=MMETSP1450 /ASSEMBLY_ACC=CAM_ASM_001115 /LENGTH=180 /DNA_ID=CAMNT_0044029919 /DNA_START=178 /DNA_END=720 /DNA_ORIENTATION=-
MDSSSMQVENPVASEMAASTDPIADLVVDTEEQAKVVLDMLDSMGKAVSETKKAVKVHMGRISKNLAVVKRKASKTRNRAQKGGGTNNGAFTKPCVIDPRLLSLLRCPPGTMLSRNEVRNKVIQLLESQNLRVDPEKKNKYKLPVPYQNFFNTTDTEVTMFSINKHVSPFIESSKNTVGK